RGSWAQPVQMAGMKGLVTSPSGRIIELPVKHSFKEGFDVLEYFISTHGARKGTSDTALRTSASGYLTRRLVDVAHEMIISEKDCKDEQGYEVFKEESEEIGQDFRLKIVGRISVGDIKDPKTKEIIAKKNEAINWTQAKVIDDNEKIKSVKVFSPITCKSRRKVCQKCYGWDMGRNDLVELGLAVGVIAAQSIGEPGTQLTMRTFHTGGVSSVGDITRGLPRVEEVFETRTPKGESIIVLNDGVVKDIDLENGRIKIASPSKVKKGKEDLLEYRLPLDIEVFVKKGDEVKAGQGLCQGSLDLKKLYKLTSQERTQRYIVQEIQRIYSSEGINIHDKHIEVIVRQMFSRARIVDPGDGPWVPGQIVTKSAIAEINQKIKKEGKAPVKAKTILLGISRVALTSDSFLSSASFQETSRVLISAALSGAEDRLRGLKENVIIGRLIPAGTSFRKQGT
ncbi:DNA-directed RNA polymerase subunit beta', partial [Candidatus Gribaldobacteria bacterium]|nr:DNA-directed RNA polymerase subunit beta' [Candidatus Gribaldobacteria bacterium]